jgi:hypothetical protein
MSAADYADYPDKDWDNDRVMCAMKELGHGRPGPALAYAGAVRHPDRRRKLQEHIDQVGGPQDPRPFMVQVAQDCLGLTVVWPPPPRAVPAYQGKAKGKAGRKK